MEKIIRKLKIEKRVKNKTKQEILKFVERKLKEGVYPTRDEIAQKFRVGVRHYFKNMRHLYDLVYTRKKVVIHPSKLSKKYFRNIVKNYINNKIKNNIYPSRNDIEIHFKIDIRSTFYIKKRLTLEEFYEHLGFPNDFAKKAKRDSYSNSRPVSYAFNSVNSGRKEIINFIRNESKAGRIPTRKNIQCNFKINLNPYFNSLKEAYDLAGVSYNRPDLNIIFSKERKLTQIVKLICLKKGYNIKRISIEAKRNRNRGPDLIIKDKEGNRIVIEIKAYHKNSSIGNVELNQLKKYMGGLGIKQGVLVTTCDKLESKIVLPNNINVILGPNLINIANELSLDYLISQIGWVRSSYATDSREKHANKIREEIKNYVKQELASGRFPFRKTIQKKFNVHIESYFDCTSIYDLFKLLNVEIPPKFRSPKEKKELVVKYIKEKFQKESLLATRIEIEKTFQVALTRHFGSKNTLMKAYQAANVPVPLRFFPKQQVIMKIARYVKNRLDNNKIILRKDIKSKFGICPEGLIRKKFMEKIIKLAKSLDSS